MTPLPKPNDITHDETVSYLLEMTRSLSIMANNADLPNASAMLSACARLINQESQYQSHGRV